MTRSGTTKGTYHIPTSSYLVVVVDEILATRLRLRTDRLDDGVKAGKTSLAGAHLQGSADESDVIAVWAEDKNFAITASGR